ncbi:MAG: hypothetical protein Q9161_009648 [Pseudevernia consocians]
MDRPSQHRQDPEGEEQRGHAENVSDTEMDVFVLTEIEEKRQDMAYLPLFTATPSLVPRLIRILLERAGTMFRWAELQIELFTNKSRYSRESIREKLDRLENMVTRSGLSDLDKLTEAYQEVYDIVKDRTAKSRASLVYKMLLCAFADLSMKDLVEAIRSVTKPEDVDEINSVYINDICSCFLTGDDTVRFAHASAQEFLEDLKDKDNALLYTSEQQHVAAEFLCLSTIKQSGTWQNEFEPITLDNADAVRQLFDDFLWYSCSFWPFHCREIPPSTRKSPHSQGFESISQYIANFMISSSFRKWQSFVNAFLYDMSVKYIRSKGSSINPHTTLKRCISQQRILSYTDSPGLLIAVFDFYEVMDILTSRILKPNPIVLTDKNGRGETMLVVACAFGSHNTLHRLKILVPDDFKKLCTKPKSGLYADSFLHRAIKSKSVKTVSLLLDNGADVSEYVKVSPHLPNYLRHKVDITSPRRVTSGFAGGTTLHQAVGAKSAIILNKLLEHARTHLSKEKLRKLLLTLNEWQGSALCLTIRHGRASDERSVAMAGLLLEYASSNGSLRPILSVGFRHWGSALDLCAQIDYGDFNNVSEMLLVLLKHTSGLPVEAKQELVSAVGSEGRTARDNVALYGREDQVAILDREIPKILGNTVVWNSNIASGEMDSMTREDGADDEEWLRSWRTQQREWRAKEMERVRSEEKVMKKPSLF